MKVQVGKYNLHLDNHIHRNTTQYRYKHKNMAYIHLKQIRDYIFRN